MIIGFTGVTGILGKWKNDSSQAFLLFALGRQKQERHDSSTKWLSARAASI